MPITRREALRGGLIATGALLGARLGLPGLPGLESTAEAATLACPLGFIGEIPMQTHLVRSYMAGTAKDWPTAQHLAAVAAGKRIVLTQKLPPVQLAAGRYDGWLKARRHAVATAGGDWIVGFWHEPEGDMTPDVYRAAQQHVATIFRQAPNIRIISVLANWTFRQGNGDTWWPGDWCTDILGVDVYNGLPGCTSTIDGNLAPGAKWRDFGSMAANAHDYAESRGKKLMIAEFGSVADTADLTRKAQWVTDAGAWMKAHPRTIGAAWFNNLGVNAKCNWHLRGPALQAFEDLLADPYFG
jgi:hypothetical protein